MKIINTGCFYFTKDDSAYRGRIQLSRAEFAKAIKAIMRNKNVSEHVNGSGKYPYLAKTLLRDDLVNRGLMLKDRTQYALRVGFAEYINKMFTNTSRYNFKRQNYLIEVIN